MARKKKRKFLSNDEVLSIIGKRLEKGKPFSLIRIGDGENICLAQKKVWSIKKVLRSEWAQNSRKSNVKGVKLPNLRLRDKMIRAIRRADIVGIPHKNEKEILANKKYLRSLTEKCFQKYKLDPPNICHTLVNRHLPEKKAFWDLLKDRNVMVISKWAKAFRKHVRKTYPSHNIKIIPVKFDNFSQIDKVLKKIKPIDADIVLVSAGVNALVLVDKLKRTQKRIAIDFGKSAMFMVKHKKRIHPWVP